MSSMPPEGTGSASLANPLPGTSRYELVAKIAAGGMAMVYVGRLRGAAGFWRLCAIKRAHAHLVEDPELRRSLIAEARLASRIRHPNVVAISDVEELEGELLLVMDYVEGAALSDLFRFVSDERRTLPPRVAVRIVLDVCAGLGAAHELLGDDGAPLGIVHRDVSPQNVLVGLDGISRVVDFGIAKCRDVGGTTGKTLTGVLKGKVAYMSPEYVRGRAVDLRGDIFGLGVVLWESLTGARLFRADTELETMTRVTGAPALPVSEKLPSLGTALDDVIARALEKAPARRFASMRDFASALEAAAAPAGLVGSHAEVAAEVSALAGPALERRRALVRERTQAPTAAGGAPAPPADATDDDVSVSITLSDTASTLRALPAAQSSAGARPQGAGVATRAGVAMAIAALLSGGAAAVVFSIRDSAHPAPPPPEPAPAAAPATVALSAAPEPSSEPPAASAAPVASAEPPAPPPETKPLPVRPRPPPPLPRPRPAPAKKDTPDPNPYGAK